MNQSLAQPADIDCRSGIGRSIDRTIKRLVAVEWYYYLVAAYGFLIPVVAMNLPGVGGVGAADLLMPIGGIVLFCRRRKGRLQMAHLALAVFTLAALISLTQITELKPAIDCTIRWVRLFGIFIPFFFSLFMPVHDRVLNCAFGAWMAGGLMAIAIGTVLHVFQIEVREGQQRLWMHGASMLRAGGLIGNSGAFAHMAATWALTTAFFFMAVSKNRFRILLAGAAIFMFLYVVYISSSRAALMNMMVAGALFTGLYRIPKRWHQWAVLGGVYGVLGIVLLFCVSQCLPESNGGGASNAFETNMKRFIPGYGGTSSSEFTSNRVDNWPEYIAMMDEKVVTGWGYKMGVRLHEESPDNSYISVMLETGVFGFLCMSMFVMANFYRLFCRYYAHDPYAIILIPVCAGQLANCMTSDIYTFWITMPVVFLLLGLVTQRIGKGRLSPD